MIGKVTAFFKAERWFKHPRLDQISTSVDACAIVGDRSQKEFWGESAVGLKNTFKVYKN